MAVCGRVTLDPGKQSRYCYKSIIGLDVLRAWINLCGHATDASGSERRKWKAPMVLVAIFTKLFQQLVIDVVGPLPVTETGYRYIPTMLCPATKFPEVLALREATSECCEFTTVYLFLNWIPSRDPN